METNEALKLPKRKILMLDVAGLANWALFMYFNVWSCSTLNHLGWKTNFKITIKNLCYPLFKID